MRRVPLIIELERSYRSRSKFGYPLATTDFILKILHRFIPFKVIFNSSNISTYKLNLSFIGISLRHLRRSHSPTSLNMIHFPFTPNFHWHSSYRFFVWKWSKPVILWYLKTMTKGQVVIFNINMSNFSINDINFTYRRVIPTKDMLWETSTQHHVELCVQNWEKRKRLSVHVRRWSLQQYPKSYWL